MAVFQNRINLSKDNFHLKDVFTDNYYLELGNVNPSKLQKLLKKKLVSYDDLTYFDIQNKGIGNSLINEEELKRKIPYYYFASLVNKDRSKQLFITYGLLVQRKGYKEFFTPIILIPVNMYFYDNSIYFQMISNPIENPYLPTYKKFNDSQSDKLLDIYNLDTFCIESFKQEKANLRLESYLTIANTYISNEMLYSEKLSLDGPSLNIITSGFDVRKESDICQITSLNQNQRAALEQSAYGNSFAISGILGTGKTRTLENIAANGIYHGKRILYVSNCKETLDEVESFFASKNLDYLVSNLDNPLKLHHIKKPSISKGPLLDSIVKGELETKYDGVKDYSKLLYERIQNFYFIDVLKGLIEYKDVENNLDKIALKGIENLYRLDAEEINIALKTIDQNLSKLESFKESKFNNIPIKNSAGKEEILDILHNLSASYKELVENKNNLERDYHFDTISNYAYFRNIINNYRQLDKDNIPESWLSYDIKDYRKKKLVYYEKAVNLFPKLENEVNDARNKESLLSKEYNTEYLSEIDSHYSINLLLSKYKNEDEAYTTDRINNFLKNNKHLITELDDIKKVISDCEYNFGKMRDKIGVKVGYKDTETIEQIVPFIIFFGKSKVPKSWLDEKNSSGIRKKIVATLNKLEEYAELTTLYLQHFTDLNNVENNIVFLKKRKEKNEKFHNVSCDELIEKLERLNEISATTDVLFTRFYELTLSEFPSEENAVERFDEFNNLLHAIKDDNIRNKLIKNLTSLNEAALEEFIKPFIIFSVSYVKIKDLFKELYSFGLHKKENANLQEMIQEIASITEYCKKIISIQESMSKIIRRELSYVPYQEYLILDNRIKDLVITRTLIERNEKYKVLFGQMFNGYNTDIEKISNEILHFDLYMNIFKDNDGIKSSLDIYNKKELVDLLDKCYELCEKVNELIKDYSKVFKEGVAKFYYNDMQEDIDLIDSLSEAEDELTIYLKVADAMKVLDSKRLYELNRYIVYHDNETFEGRFMNAFYSYLYDLFVKDHPEIVNSEGYHKLLTDIIEWEDEVCNLNIDKIKIERDNNTFVNSLKSLNYMNYFNKTQDSKYLYLMDTKMVNLFVNPAYFDLVLVDDAHLLSYDQYSILMNAPQIIFAGLNDIRYSISQDVFSKIKKSAIIDLKYRFTKTPLELLNNMSRASGNFYSDNEKNKAYRVSDASYIDEIYSLITYKGNEVIKLNNDIKINYYTTSISNIRGLFDNLSDKLFNDGFSNNDIYSVLTNQINMCDLRNAFEWDADYNIVELKEYFAEQDDNESMNLFSRLLCAKKGLIVIDELDIKTSNVDKYPLLRLLNNIEAKESAITPINDELCKRLSQSLSRHQVKVLGKYKDIDLIIQHHNKNYGVIVYNAPSDFGCDILNSYRTYAHSNFPCSILFINEFINDYSEKVKQIAEGVKDVK